jgi:hypothetical protein
MNYTTLVSDLQSWTENFGTEFVAAIPDIVKIAEDRIYHAVQLPAWRKTGTLTTTLSTQTLTLPADFISLSSLVLTTSNRITPLLCKDIAYIREAWPDTTTTGIPRAYALYNKTTVILGPTPAAAYTITAEYFYKPESIVTAANTWVGDNMPSVLFYGALVEAYTYMKGDTELQGRYRALYDEALARLKELGEGDLKRDDFRSDRNRLNG